jgi:hypothetical protein
VHQRSTYCGYTVLTVALIPIKVVLCTNVAETSLTVDDCCVVIDSGRQKSAECAPRPRHHHLRLHMLRLQLHRLQLHLHLHALNPTSAATPVPVGT